MFELVGQANVEKRILDSWPSLGQETQGELLYSGIANPSVFSNEFSVKLFHSSPQGTNRMTIVCSLYSTRDMRQFPTGELAQLIRAVGPYDDLDLSARMSAQCDKMLKNLARSS
jgi:hypothetical protein